MQNNWKLKISQKLAKVFVRFIFLTPIFVCVISCTSTINLTALKDNKNTDSLRNELFKHEVSKLNLVDGDTLVDIGSQTGFHAFQLFHFYPNKFFILEDVTRKYFKNLKNPYIEFKAQKKYFKHNSIKIKGTSEKIPLNSDAYKTILCRMSLHEFKKPAKMLNEIKRILTKDGILIVEELIPRIKDEIDIGCKMKHLTKDEIVNLLSLQGLKLISSDTTNWEIRNANEANMNILMFKK